MMRGAGWRHARNGLTPPPEIVVRVRCEHVLDQGDAVFGWQCPCPLDQRLGLVAHLGSLRRASRGARRERPDKLGGS